jgi:hypothetical protein
MFYYVTWNCMEKWARLQRSTYEHSGSFGAFGTTHGPTKTLAECLRELARRSEMSYEIFF